MRVFDALKTVFRKSGGRHPYPLTTVWTERADDSRVSPLADYPRPAMVRPEWICLNGLWEYAFTDRADFWPGPDGEIVVPFSPETARSTVGRVLRPDEALWYRRELILKENAAGRRLLLHFGAVDERCTVWLNGERLGRHRGGYLPFSFDITPYIREGENELLLRALDETDRGTACRGKQKLEPGGMFYTPQSGIWQTVWMEWVPERYIQKLNFTPHLSIPAEGGGIAADDQSSDADGSLRTAATESGEIEICLYTDSPSDGEILIGQAEDYSELDSETEDGYFSEYTKTIAGEDMQVSISGTFSGRDFDESGVLRKTIRIRSPQCWSPESPYLYPVKIRMGEDEVQSFFAMRSFGTGRDAAGRPCLTLNGKPYFFHGILDQGYWPESLMTAPSDAAMLFDIHKMKAHGFNMLRKHVKIEPLRWYYHCDRLGMIVWQDMVNGGGAINALLETYIPTVIPAVQKTISDRHHRLLSRGDAAERERFREQLMEMIRHLSGEPCIGMWVIFNEGWGQFDAAELTEAVKQLDPTRPVDHASGWFDQGAGDVLSVHNYFRTLKAERDPAGRPYVISEYGGIACCISGHIFTDNSYGYAVEAPETFRNRFDALMEEICSLWGTGLAGAVYTQVSDIEEEINGLLTYDRKNVKTGRVST